MKEINEILENVYLSVLESGKDPILLITGYLTQGEARYITRKRDARAWITSVSRRDILRSLLSEYFEALRNAQDTSFEKNKTAAVLHALMKRADEKGVNAIEQLCPYLMRSQPAYITAGVNAKNETLTANSMDIVREIVRNHFEHTL